MIEVNLLVFIALIELIIFLLIALISLAGTRMSAAKKARNAASRLVDTLNTNEDKRTDFLQEILQTRLGFDAEMATKVASLLIRKEKAFYQAFINIYLKRDSCSIPSINLPFEAAVDVYHDLFQRLEAGVVAASNTEAAENNSDGNSMSHAAAASLQDENESLKDDLKSTMETMSNMLTEYSNMYSASVDDNGSDKNAVLSMFQEDENEEIAISENEVSAVSGEASEDENNQDIEPSDKLESSKTENIESLDNIVGNDMDIDTLLEQQGAAKTNKANEVEDAPDDTTIATQADKEIPLENNAEIDDIDALLETNQEKNNTTEDTPEKVKELNGIDALLTQNHADSMSDVDVSDDMSLDDIDALLDGNSTNNDATTDINTIDDLVIESSPSSSAIDDDMDLLDIDAIFEETENQQSATPDFTNVISDLDIDTDLGPESDTKKAEKPLDLEL